jgi:hypothetical protein
VTFWYGSGASDPYLWQTDRGLDLARDPALFVSDFKDANKNKLFFLPDLAQDTAFLSEKLNKKLSFFVSHLQANKNKLFSPSICFYFLEVNLHPVLRIRDAYPGSPPGSKRFRIPDPDLRQKNKYF